MSTKIETAYADVMTAIMADRDRSVEGAIARGIRAGIKLERDRINAIFELPAPEGLQRAAILMALGNASIDDVLGLFALHAAPPTPVTAAEVRARRAAFKLIENNSTTESFHVGQTP
jgi:hypothetical protein